MPLAIQQVGGKDPPPSQLAATIDAIWWHWQRLSRIRRFLTCHSLRLTICLVRQGGIAALVRFLAAKLHPIGAYRHWIRCHEPDTEAIERQRAIRLMAAPKFSIVTPVWNTPEPFLRAMIESVIAQTHQDWELCIALAPCDAIDHRPLLRVYAQRDRRIRIAWLERNRGIAGNSNAALAMASGDFVAFLDHDDELAPFALHEVARAVQASPGADFLYSDEDKIDVTGQVRKDHHFKPRWSPETLLAQNYITHLTIIRRDLMDQLGGFRDGYEGSQDYDLILRATERARTIVHIPRVLYHWRCHRDSVAQVSSAKMYAYESGRRALSDHLKRRGLAGSIEHRAVPGTYRHKMALSQPLMISIISDGPSRWNGDCEALRGDWQYPLEVILAIPSSAGKRSRIDAFVRVIECKAASQSPRLQAGAAAARGDLLLFVRRGLRPMNNDWLARLAATACLPEIGAVGGRITDASGSHYAGPCAIGVCGLVGNLHRGFAEGSPGYGCRLITAHNVSAVCGDCMMMRRTLFEELGGFDVGFHSALWDADFCLRAIEAGYRVVWTPDAELRSTAHRPPGPSLQSRSCAADRRRFETRWRRVLRTGDPHYSRGLTTEWDDCSINLH